MDAGSIPSRKESRGEGSGLQGEGGKTREDAGRCFSLFWAQKLQK